MNSLNRRPLLCATGLIATFLFASPATAAPVPFTPNNMLSIRFTVSTELIGEPDMLLLLLGENNVTQEIQGLSAWLYDGDVLLGRHDVQLYGFGTGILSLNPGGSWTSSTSPWSHTMPPNVPFGAIQSGAIDGRIIMRMASGHMDLDLANVSLLLGSGVDHSSFNVVTPDPLITSLEIVPIPEPATLALGSLMAITGIAVARRRRRRRA